MHDPCLKVTLGRADIRAMFTIAGIFVFAGLFGCVFTRRNIP
jgi:hypothetical protein